jgi:hypothetical protein
MKQTPLRRFYQHRRELCTQLVSNIAMVRTIFVCILAGLPGGTCMAQTLRPPDVEAQRAAMKKLGFLVGEWSGEASVLRGPGQFVELAQTESAQFKLDGLVLVIEGVGRTRADGKLALQALGLISFDDETGTYKMRAFNDGRWLETDVKLADGGNSISWGFALGEFKTRTVMRINENGEWNELGELVIGDRPPQKMMDLKVRRSSGPK